MRRDCPRTRYFRVNLAMPRKPRTDFSKQRSEGKRPMRTRTRLLTLACGLSLLGLAYAAQTAQPARTAAPANRPWTAAGGTVTVRWNRELARDLGIRIAATGNAQRLGAAYGDRFTLDAASPLRFKVENGYFRGVASGQLRARGGYTLSLRDGSLALRDFRLVPRMAKAGQAPQQFDLVGTDGTPWFHVDRLMHELADHDNTFAVRTSDIRISTQLARRLGQPEVAGWTIGEVQLAANVTAKGSGAMPLAPSIVWDGDPAPNGGTYQNDLFMKSITAQYMRCNGCSGENGSGDVAIAPSSTLRNNVNQGSISATVPGDPRGTSKALYAASIPWYSKFSGNFAPYNNDQHPYLIWNMYRVNLDGSFEQIGRSGVKQAFLTVNVGCLDANDHDAHVLGRGCEDTYSTSNNDNNNSLSPRWEILPYSGKWGRCGSTYDTNCDGVANASPATDSYYQRMLVKESQIAPSRNTGATFYFDSWYLARKDIDIYNSMATLRTTQSWTGSVWNISYTAQTLGPAIDRWVAPGTPRTRGVLGGNGSVPLRVLWNSNGGRGNIPTLEGAELNEELSVDGVGHAKVAVRAIKLGANQWRYHYAVMNFDVMFSTTTGAEPNLRITGNRGFESFALLSSATASAPVFRDGDLSAGNDWSFGQGSGAITWTNGGGAPTSLFWGTMYSFSIDSTAAPRYGIARLRSDATSNQTYDVRTIVPGT